MFTFKKKDGNYKEYKARKVKVGTSRNGNDYTMFSISNKISDNNYENVTVFCWENLPLKDDDMVTINAISSFESKLEEYQGKQLLKTTIYATINIIGGSTQPPTQPKIMEEMGTIDDLQLPF